MLVPIVKKLQLCYWFAIDGGTKSLPAQIIDKSFLQQLLECRSGGRSLPTNIAIKWTTSESKVRIPITSLLDLFETMLMILIIIIMIAEILPGFVPPF